MRNNFLLFSLVMKPVDITILGLLPCLPHKEHLLPAGKCHYDHRPWWCCVQYIDN